MKLPLLFHGFLTVFHDKCWQSSIWTIIIEVTTNQFIRRRRRRRNLFATNNNNIKQEKHIIKVSSPQCHLSLRWCYDAFVIPSIWRWLKANTVVKQMCVSCCRRSGRHRRGCSRAKVGRNWLARLADEPRLLCLERRWGTALGRAPPLRPRPWRPRRVRTSTPSRYVLRTYCSFRHHVLLRGCWPDGSGYWVNDMFSPRGQDWWL